MKIAIISPPIVFLTVLLLNFPSLQLQLQPVTSARTLSRTYYFTYGPSPVPWTSHQCGNGWTPAEAQSFCQTIGPNVSLATFHSQEEFDVALGLVPVQDYLDVWIDLTRVAAGQNTWQWSDGSPVHYLAWASNEPDTTTQMCVAVYGMFRKWIDCTCDNGCITGVLCSGPDYPVDFCDGCDRSTDASIIIVAAVVPTVFVLLIVLLVVVFILLKRRKRMEVEVKVGETERHNKNGEAESELEDWEKLEFPNGKKQ